VRRGTGFLDLDHHGWEDLFIANGHDLRFPPEPDIPRRQKPVLLRNQGGGKFTDITARGGPYFQKEHLSRGVGLGDLDNDGCADLIVSQLNEPATVLRNVSGTSRTHWLGIELAGKDHADVVGRGFGWRRPAARRPDSPRAAAATPPPETGGISLGWARPTKP
jgi:enediyne biosynthesis protein E4